MAWAAAVVGVCKSEEPSGRRVAVISMLLTSRPYPNSASRKQARVRKDMWSSRRGSRPGAGGGGYVGANGADAEVEMDLGYYEGNSLASDGY